VEADGAAGFVHDFFGIYFGIEIAFFQVEFLDVLDGLLELFLVEEFPGFKDDRLLSWSSYNRVPWKSKAPDM